MKSCHEAASSVFSMASWGGVRGLLHYVVCTLEALPKELWINNNVALCHPQCFLCINLACCLLVWSLVSFHSANLLL